MGKKESRRFLTLGEVPGYSRPNKERVRRANRDSLQWHRRELKKHPNMSRSISDRSRLILPDV